MRNDGEVSETLYVKAVERRFIDHANRGDVEWHTLVLESGDGSCVARIGRLEPFEGLRSKQVVDLRVLNQQTVLETEPDDGPNPSETEAELEKN